MEQVPNLTWRELFEARTSQQIRFFHPAGKEIFSGWKDTPLPVCMCAPPLKSTYMLGCFLSLNW
jgi:hypothetical protein